MNALSTPKLFEEDVASHKETCKERDLPALSNKSLPHRYRAKVHRVWFDLQNYELQSSANYLFF
jgi:hypothetical protein